jgi:hypothetical protein
MSAAAIVAALTAGPAAANDGPTVRLEHAFARVVVIVEERADIGVEIEQGNSGLPVLEVSRRSNEIIIKGDLRGGNAIRNCQSDPGGALQPGEDASVEVGVVGTVKLADAPLIILRTPRAVRVNVESGAVFGSVGRNASSIQLASGGCGDWTIADTDGDVLLLTMGSGDMSAGTSRRLAADIMGSGSIKAGATQGLQANVMGSGDISAVRVDGPVEVNVMGSGDINIPDTVESIQAIIMGSGDINVAGATGAVTRSGTGSGQIVIAGKPLRQRLDNQ